MANRGKAEPKRVEALDRIANLLALLLAKDIKQGDAVVQLSRAGFSDEDIANLLHTTKGTIKQARYMANKKKPT